MAPARCATLVSTVITRSINATTAAVSLKSSNESPRKVSPGVFASASRSAGRSSFCRQYHSARSPSSPRMSASAKERLWSFWWPVLPLHTRPILGWVLAPSRSCQAWRLFGSLCR